MDRCPLPLRTSALWYGKGVQELESCLTSLGRISLAHPGYAGSNEAGRFGGKKEAYGLARGKVCFRLQSQAISGEVNGSSEVFSLVTLYHESNSHLDPLTLRWAIK